MKYQLLDDHSYKKAQKSSKHCLLKEVPIRFLCNFINFSKNLIDVLLMDCPPELYAGPIDFDW